jgi:hypothetical protein
MNYKKEKVLILKYYELSKELKELINEFKFNDNEYPKKDSYFKIDEADEFEFHHINKEALDKYIEENDLIDFFWKPAFDLYYYIALQLLENKEKDFDSIMVHYTW